MGLPPFMAMSEIPTTRLHLPTKEVVMKNIILTVLLFVLAVVAGPAQARTDDPLASWNEGATKTAIVEFVEKVTAEDSPTFVPPDERIATFDNDGTLWVEYPMYTQVLFAFERIKELAPQHPEWKTTQPFNALLEGDMKTVGGSGMEGLMKIVMASHSGMTATEFEQEVIDWMAKSEQPRFKRPYSELIYQPQLELLAFLRANGFKTFIVSGGGVAFMRPFTEKAYGIPPYQVVGSSVVSEFQIKDGTRRKSSACRKLTSSMTRRVSQWAFTITSVADRFWRSVTRTATCR